MDGLTSKYYLQIQRIAKQFYKSELNDDLPKTLERKVQKIHNMFCDLGDLLESYEESKKVLDRENR